MIFLILLLLLFPLSNADIYLVEFSYGKYDIKFVFNNETISTSYVAYTGANFITNTLYFQTVITTSDTTSLVCRQISQQKIIWGPNGCSNINNPELALQSANCIPNEIDIELRRNILQVTWYLSKISSACFFAGGNGDIRLCGGPLRLSIPNRDSFLPNQIFTVDDFFASTMTFIDILVGPYAMAPALFEVNMVQPAMTSITDCYDTTLDKSFQCSWSNIGTDPLSDMDGIIKVFIGSCSPDIRMVFQRTSSTSITFRILLCNTIAEGENLSCLYQSDIIDESGLDSGHVLFLNVIQQIHWNESYIMYDLNTTTPVCNFTLNKPDTFEYTLIPPYPVTSANYSFNINPRRFYRTRLGNAMHGRLTITGELVYPNCPEGEVCGGDIEYINPQYPQGPIYVPPNPTLAFRFDCNEFYPKNNTFRDSANILQSRISIFQEQCFSPFLSQALIDSALNPNEASIQCQKLGGYTWGRAQTMCAKSITTIECQIGWFPFDQRCFYKFNPVSETRFSVVFDEAQQACTNLNKYAQALIEVDEYTDLWLMNYFIYQDPNINTIGVYRIPLFDSEDCGCYVTHLAIFVQCPCFSLQLDDQYQIFPICYYKITQSELEPEYADMSVTLPTARLLRFGQIGPKFGGAEAIVKCRNGWDGKICNTPTCGIDVSENIASPLNTFFRKCYSLKRGSCYSMQPRVCQCNYGYGPSASIIPSLTNLYQFKDTPCACPAGIQTSGSFQINDNVYSGDVYRLPCSGINQGICLVGNTTNVGVCSCTLRQNLVFNHLEPAYDGKACSCSTPIQPSNADTKNGPIVTALCNNNGICCPFGQTVSNPINGDFYSSRCFDSETGEGLQGCICNNGKGGPACTCPTPFNRCENQNFQITDDETFYYINMGQKYFIYFISLTNCGTPTSVQLSNEVGKTIASLSCTLNTTSLLYDCPSILAYQYVVLQDPDIESCIVKAFERNFEYCGANNTINSFAGRMFDIPTYRGIDKNIDLQKVNVANFGCTNTDCMCNSNFGGELCALRVSSIRPTIIEIREEIFSIQAKRYCGETTPVPELSNSIRGRGQLNTIHLNCTCNAISNVDNTGQTGITTEQFIGEACQCANAYNEDRNSILTCAGHGTCISPSFPYGYCSVDLEKYRTDSLYNPFIEVVSGLDEETTMIVQEDTYFLAGTFLPTSSPTSQPTLSPTKHPSKTPTKSPTRSPTKPPTKPPTRAPTTKIPTNAPTTKVPTKSPTQPTMAPTISGTVIRFFGSSPSTGNLGWRYQTTETCRIAIQSYGVACRDTPALLSYNNTDNVVDLPLNYNFDPTSNVFAGTTSINFGQWNSIIGGSISQSLISTGIVSKIAIWTGTDPDGTQAPTSFRCNLWQSSSSLNQGRIGDTGVTTSDWLSSTIVSGVNCNSDPQFICLCIQGTATPTTSPTKFPTTKTPSKNPTTANPSKNPTTSTPTSSPTLSKTIIIYESNLGVVNGNRGSSSTTSANCVSAYISQGINCDNTNALFVQAFLCYDSTHTIQSRKEDMVGTDNAYLEGPTGIRIGDWNTAIGSGGVLTNSLATAGITGTTFWTGCNVSGGAGGTDSANRCNSWTSASSSNEGRLGSTTSTTGGEFLFSGTLIDCDLTRRMLCMCKKT